MDEQVTETKEMVEVGPGIGMWATELSEPAGRFLVVRDVNGKTLTHLKFQMWYKQAEGRHYYMYVPLPEGEELKQFLLEVAKNERIDLGG